MAFCKVPRTDDAPRLHAYTPSPAQANTGGTFKSALAEATRPSRSPRPMGAPLPAVTVTPNWTPETIPATNRLAAAAYQHQAPPPSAPATRMSGWQRYKDEQLLSNPGGDHYHLGPKPRVQAPKPHASFRDRIGKDCADALANMGNGFKNLFMGATRHYRDSAGQIKPVKTGGVFRAIGSFFKNVGHALSLGQWHPDQDPAPRGIVERSKFVFSRLKQAVFGDLMQGVGGSTIQVGENLLLAGWNLVEIVPDATLGSFEAGRKLTTTVFDNGQVLVDYLTDILPTGEAWLRVHATDLKGFKAPIIYNINLNERFDGDERWRYVRNTPFRKTIETLGSLLADIVTVKLFSNTQLTSEGRKDSTSP